MGAHLVGAALNPHWQALLTPTERLILVAMCLTASDTPTLRNGQTTGLYWAGHEALMIVALGDVPERDTPAYRSAKRLIERRIARLIEVGAIELVHGGQGRGQRAYYRVRPGLFAVDNSPTDSASLPEKAGQNSRLLDPVKPVKIAGVTTVKAGQNSRPEERVKRGER